MNDWPRPHYFFAVKLPDETKSFLSRWVGGAFPKDWFGRWVHPLDYHITMAFLGNVKENKVKDFSLRMADMLKEETAFPLTLGETGYFGKKDSPRVFWAGVQDSPPLAELQRKIFRLCLDEGFRLDQKPFRPHITLARKGTEHLEPGSVVKPIHHPEGTPHTFFVEQVVLYKTARRESPKYQELVVMPLKK